MIAVEFRRLVDPSCPFAQDAALISQLAALSSKVELTEKYLKSLDDLSEEESNRRGHEMDLLGYRLLMRQINIMLDTLRSSAEPLDID